MPQRYAPKQATINRLLLRLASPERVLAWSCGEVTKPETINYRTQRSEKNGLFDERIFGPEHDFECYCGKYRGIRYKQIVCEKCGVEVTRSIVRRERMGHIKLATPVAHIWFLKNIPSRIALIVGVSAPDLEKVIYFAAYIVRSIDETERTRLLKELEHEFKNKLKDLQDEKSKTRLKDVYAATKRDVVNLKAGTILDDVMYGAYAARYSGLFEAETGAEAVYNILKDLDLKKVALELEEELASGKVADTKKLRKRLSVVRAMIKARIRPEWMFLTAVPVIPAALRPMVALEGGRHATSDVNDLYRRVINRNNRLKKLIEISAPNVILRNEKRILQEAVDALIDNAMRQGSATVNQAQRRPLKSLSDNLRGKQGLFRGNLLGKRVDYSGRSVIVVGPELRLDQCGLPKTMALELFRPFVIQKLLAQELAFNIRGAGRLIEEATPEVWAALEEVIADKYVLLNRAPTLHRLGIQAFKPVLIEGEAIQIHPLVVQAYNADFDGDQMAVHVPLSKEAQTEAREIMASSKNLLSPGKGTPIISVAHQDIILGCYWMTKIVPGETGEGKVFESPNAAITAHEYGGLSIRARIKVLPTDKPKYNQFTGLFETSVGRLLFNAVLSSDYPFINEVIDKKRMARLVTDVIARYDSAEVMDILDRIKHFGFTYSTRSGTTFGMSDVMVPQGKHELVDGAMKEARQIDEQFEEGLWTQEEAFRQKIEIFHGLRNDMEKLIEESIDEESSVSYMWKSGARGSLSQITNMAGLKGLIAGSTGRTIEFPIISSVAEGFTPIEYFINTHSSRKGLGDTALNTAQSGYLTRRLFDVAQDVIVGEEDCGTREGVLMRAENLGGIEVPLAKNIEGRVVAETVKAPDGALLFKRGDYLSEEDAEEIERAGIAQVVVRSPMTCESVVGMCRLCYGKDLGTGKIVELGEAVGTVAAQSIGEPATQLTMRTFHHGGRAAQGGDIVQGLPRVEEIFERRPPKNPAVISEVSGTVLLIADSGTEKTMTILPDAPAKRKTKKTPSGKEAGVPIARAEKEKATEAVTYSIPYNRVPLVAVGEAVEKGQLLTDGSADLKMLFRYAGREKTQNYIIREISKIYEMQGASVSRKHIEVIIRQMFSRLHVTDQGETNLTEGDVVEERIFELLNREARERGLKEAKARALILGIARVALSRASFLSAASFQNTNKVLIDAAMRGSVDELRGLKENVIIGHLIPAGSGFPGSPKWNMVQRIRGEEEE